MPKSYKICHSNFFNKSKFVDNKLNLNSQQHLSMFAESPTASTNITKIGKGFVIHDFETYLIEHEHNVNIRGRYGSQRFNNFLRLGEINGYYSEERSLFLLQGKKDDVIDFCKFTDNTDLLEISTIEIQMSDLIDKLGSVRNCWFKFSKGSISSSALFGENIENTIEFQDAKQLGDITALSFFYADDGMAHAVMVTNDGAVVLQFNYPNVDMEIELVLKIKKDLLDGLYTEKPITKRRK